MRMGLRAESYPYEERAEALSGASALKAKLTRSIGCSEGMVRSRRRAMRVESTPPENKTAIWLPLRVQLTNYLTLAISSDITLWMIPSST